MPYYNDDRNAASRHGQRRTARDGHARRSAQRSYEEQRASARHQPGSTDEPLETSSYLPQESNRRARRAQGNRNGRPRVEQRGRRARSDEAQDRRPHARTGQADNGRPRRRSRVNGAEERRQERGAHSAASPRRNAAAASKKKRHGKLKAALIAVAIVLVVGAGSAFAYYQAVSGNLHAGLDPNLRSTLVKTDLTKEPFYMLLMGTDASSEREADESFGNAFRTDSIMLVRVDPVNNKVSMVSIHRDTVVDLGEYGKQKINAAHALGGASLSVKAVSEMSGVGISHYAELNFDGFADIVDALGGVEVDVPVEIDDDDAGGHLDAGYQTLNGEQALILCRSRNTYANYADPDSMRAANQRLVLSAIIQKILESDPATIASTVKTLSQYITTDLEVSDIVGLAQAMQGLDTDNDIYTAMEPVTSKYSEEDGGWYTYTNESEWKAMIKRMDEGLPPAESTSVDEATGTVTATAGADSTDTSAKTASVSVRNGTSTAGLAAEAQSKLKDAGFTNVSTGNANSTDYDKTLIIYDDTNKQYEANTIAEALGCGTVMKNPGDYIYDGNFLVVIGSDWPGASTSSKSSSSA